MDEHSSEYPRTIKGYEFKRSIGKGAFGYVSTS
jgi:hypothetical protein